VGAARPDGLGRLYTGTVPAPVAASVWVALAALLAGCGSWAGLSWWRGALAAALAVAVVGLLVARAVRRFGGVTGDVFGAAVEVALAALLVALT
jgi:adenosylcobinamide-GDP ribazoletransferase